MRYRVVTYDGEDRDLRDFTTYDEAIEYIAEYRAYATWHQSRWREVENFYEVGQDLSLHAEAIDKLIEVKLQALKLEREQREAREKKNAEEAIERAGKEEKELYLKLKAKYEK